MSTTRTLRRVAVALVTCAFLTPVASAQLAPERLYNGKDRPLPVLVMIPGHAEGDAAIHLMDPQSGASIASEGVKEGRADLAGMFPRLWTTASPTLLYAQLIVGDEKIGAPLVLQPMLSPATFDAPANPRNPPARRPSPPPVYSGLRVWQDAYVVFETTLGEIRFRMRPDVAPNTAWNFLHLVEGGYYTDVIFHRIIGPSRDRPGFMAQVGDPLGIGSGGPGYHIQFEESSLLHDLGVVSMARTNDPNTAGGQVFICFSREGTSFLDDRYVAFAQAIDGYNTLIEIGAVDVDPNPAGEMSKPRNPPRIIRAYTVPADPFGEGPKPLSVQMAEGGLDR